MKPEPRAGRIGWKGLLEEDKYRSAGELAEVDRIDRSFVSRLLRLTALALHVVEAIPEGCREDGMVPEELIDPKVIMLENIWTGPHMLFRRSNKKTFTHCKYHIVIPDNLYYPKTEEPCYGENDRNLR